MSNRVRGICWWGTFTPLDKQQLLEKIVKIVDKINPTSTNTLKNRNIDTLTGREIELIYDIYKILIQ